MLDRYNRARLKRRDGERRSKLEDQVAENLETHGYSATYEQDKFKYVIALSACYISFTYFLA